MLLGLLLKLGIGAASVNLFSFINLESVCKTLNNELFQLNGGSHCFVIYNYTLRWYYARNKCLEGGGDLANFDEVDSLMPFHNFTTVAKGLLGNVRYFIGLQKKWWTWRGRGKACNIKQFDLCSLV